MYFQVSDYKGKNFLDLDNNNNLPIQHTYLKKGVWLKYIIKSITNHTPIGEYHLRFFPKESFTCSYGDYPIKILSLFLSLIQECFPFMKISLGSNFTKVIFFI